MAPDVKRNACLLSDWHEKHSWRVLVPSFGIWGCVPDNDEMTTTNDRKSRTPGRRAMHQRTTPFPILVTVTFSLVVLISSSYVRNAWAWSTACSLPHSYGGRFGISPTYSHHSKCTITVAAMKEDDYGDDDIDSPEQLKKAINYFSRIPRRQSPDINVAYSVPNLEELVESFERTNEGIVRDYPEYPGRWIDDTDDDDDDDADSDFDGWFLETDSYVNSRDHLNPDGSLNLVSIDTVDDEYRFVTESLLRMQTPNVPSSVMSDNELTLESLLQQRPQDPSTTSEELHRKVFEQEEGYFNQSEIFRRSLIDATAALEAARWRRGANYRRRQEEAISRLDTEISDFEAHLDEHVLDQNKVKCFRCNCGLSPEEVEHTKSTKASLRLCSLCYGDLLVAKSDPSFFRDESSPFAQNNFRQNPRSSSRKEIRQLRNKTPIAMASNIPNKLHDSSSEPKREQKDKPVSSDGDDIAMLKQEVAALQDELLHLKEDRLIPEAEKASGPWSQVVDPDTGEVFYWNEETEEMTWEL